MRIGRRLTQVLVALSAVLLIVAGILASRSDVVSAERLPSSIPPKLHGLAIRLADAKDFRVSRDYAVETARLKLMPEGPKAEPFAYPALVTGRVLPKDARVQAADVLVMEEAKDAPAWLVIWRNPEPEFLRQFTSSPHTDVDVVLFVDAITGECCLLPPLFTSLESSG